MTNAPYGVTIFCDDIRDEVAGKKTYVGIYNQSLITAGDLPAILPQFAFSIHYYEPLEMEDEAVTIRVFLPGDDKPSAEFPLDLPSARKQARKDPDSNIVGAILSFKVAPLVLQCEGRIRVRAYRSGEEIRLGTLLVQAGPEASLAAVAKKKKAKSSAR